MPRCAPATTSALLAVFLGTGQSLPAQSLPAYSSMNPMVYSRTGLATRPFADPGRRWHVTALMDYASPIEYASTQSLFYVLDAEILRMEVAVTRRVGGKGFVLGEASWNGAYNGFLDGFLAWYHNLVGLDVQAREIRPKNKFAYELNRSGGPDVSYQKSSGFLGDIRLGAGIRHSRHWQTTLSFTLPTSTGPTGYGREVASVNLSSMLRSDFGKRFSYEGTAGLGYTAKHGDFAEFQRTKFLMIAQGLRARVVGPLHLYSNIIWHSAAYHGIGTSELDGSDLTIDVGGIFKFRRGPEWIAGVTEDLRPSGPAIDVGFRLGARW